MQRGANLLVSFSLSGILFFSESEQGVKPNPRHVDGVEVAYGLDVRMAHFSEPEARNMQFVAQFGKRREANVVKGMPCGFVQRARIAAEEAAAQKSHARPQCGDIWRGQDQEAARFQYAVDLAKK